MQVVVASSKAYSLVKTYVAGSLCCSHSFAKSGILLLFLCASYYIYYTHYHPLAAVPGPWLAKTTNIWRYYHFLQGNLQAVLSELFETYQTTAIRIGPNSVAFSDSKSYKVIHGYKPGLERGDFYQMIRFADRDGERSMFSAKEDGLHREKRRKLVSVAFTPKALQSYEATIVKNVDTWLQQIVRSLKESSRFEMDVAYLNKALTFDTVYEILIGENAKFQGIWKTARFQAAIRHKEWTSKHGFGWGYVPVIAAFLELIGSVTKRQFHKQKFNYNGAPILRTLIYWQQLTRCQHSLLPAAKCSNSEGVETVMHKLLALPDSDSRKMKRDAEIMAEVRTLTFAGPGTTSAALTSILFDLAQNHEWQYRIRSEARSAYDKGYSSNQSTAPLLMAFIRESLRLRPMDPLPFHLEVILNEGISIPGCDIVLPKGTEVGALMCAVNRDKDVWGPDADVFRPERWLISDEKQLRDMRESWTVFGRGIRACPGEKIALSLIRKCVQGLLLDWGISCDPQALMGRCNFEMTFSSLALQFDPL